jgi:hypothetical protein
LGCVDLSGEDSAGRQESNRLNSASVRNDDDARWLTQHLHRSFGSSIDSDGQLGTVSSSSRYKTDIKPIEKASESILALKPVSFRYKTHKDTTPSFGLIAEEVAMVNPQLVVYDTDGKPFTVRYDAVNAMLLNEFLKEHGKVEKLEEQVAALTAGLQKVSAQIETSRQSP